MILKSKIKHQKLKILIIISLILLFNFSFLHSVIAQESSPSGSLIDKLNQLKNDIASKAAQIKTEINKKVQDKALIGEILSISDQEIVLQTVTAEKKIRFDEFTEVLGLKNKKITIKTLEENDNIAALGDVDDKNNLVATRIVFLENFATNSSELIWGQIQKSSGSTITLVNKAGETEKITTTSTTTFFLGNNEAAFADAKVEKYMVARGTRLGDGSLRARFIYFIPSLGFVKPEKKESSPSASVISKTDE